VQSTYTSVIEQSLLKWVGVTVTVQCMMQFGLLLSCDNVLKFDWYCQLSGSGSNSLNSWKLQGCFSYSLGMRLKAMT